MPAAAIQHSPTSHPGLISGPCVPKVRIAGAAAAVFGDTHECAWPSGHPPSTISTASTKVRFGGKFAARVGDLCTCGATIAAGVDKVNIG